MWDVFCIHFVCINRYTKILHHKNYLYKLYSNSYKIYRNNCMQNVSHISTYFDPFVEHFLGNHCKQFKLKTCCVTTWR